MNTEEEKRTVKVAVSLTPSEKDALREMSHALRISMSDLMRDEILKVMKQQEWI